MTRNEEEKKISERMDRFNDLMARAEATNAERDKLDGRPLRELPLRVQLQTAVSAISAGVNTEDWNCVAEGLLMLSAMDSVWTSKEG